MILKQGRTWEQLGAIDLRQVSISARIMDDEGHLAGVDGITEKIKAIRSGLVADWVNFLIVAKDQIGIAPELEKTTSGLQIIRASDLAEAVKSIYDDHGPRRAIRDYACKEFQYMKLIGRGKHETLSEQFYQRLSLLHLVTDIDQEQNVVSFPDPGFAHFNQTGAWDETIQEDGPIPKLVSLEEFLSISKQRGDLAPRLVLLGQTGSGKTEFLRNTAWVAAKRQLKYGAQELLPVLIDMREWEIWAYKNPTLAEGGLPAYLEKKFQSVGGPSVEIWRLWLNNGDVLLLCDGLHSIQDRVEFFNIYQSAIDDIPYCPIIITCRTASFDQFAEYCDGYIQFFLDSLTENQQLAFVAAYFSCTELHQAELFLEKIKCLPSLKNSTANPRLLSILCFASSKNGHEWYQLPNCQSDIFKNVINKLLQNMSSHQDGRNYLKKLSEGDADRHLLLEKVALDTQVSNTFSDNPISASWVYKDLRCGLREEWHYEENVSRKIARDFLKDLEHNSGLLVRLKDNKPRYKFLHRSIQQYLAACRLASWIERGEIPDLDSPIPLFPGKCISPRRLVDMFSWQPEQQETIIFLAGQLKTPLFLLKLLTQPEMDDLFMHRRSLAALCLLEIDLKRNNQLISLRDQLAEVIFGTWFRSYQIVDVDYFQRAIAALVQMKARIENQPLDYFLANRLRNPSGFEEKNKLIQTLRLLRSQQVSPVLIQCLGQMLCGAVTSLKEELEVQSFAMEAIIALGPSAAKKEILLPLAGLLSSPNRSLKALRAFCEIGKAAAIPEVIEGIEHLLLAQKMDDRSAEARFVLLETIRRLGIGQHPNILPILISILKDLRQYTEFERCLTASSIAETDLGMMEEEERELLLQEISTYIFHSPEKRIRDMGRAAASRAFQNTQQASIRKQMTVWFDRIIPVRRHLTTSSHLSNFTSDLFLTSLQGCDEDGELGSSYALKYAYTLNYEELRKVADDMRVIDKLVNLLRSRDKMVLNTALEIFRLLAPAYPDVFAAEKVADLYRFGDIDLRLRAVEVLGLYGEAAAQPSILKAILFRLKLPSEDPGVIKATVQALQMMGASASTYPGLMDALVDCFEKPIFNAPEGAFYDLFHTLMALISTGIQASIPAIRFEAPLNALFRRINVSTEIFLVEEINDLHRLGLRFFVNERDAVSIKTTQELCNIF